MHSNAGVPNVSSSTKAKIRSTKIKFSSTWHLLFAILRILTKLGLVSKDISFKALPAPQCKSFSTIGVDILFNQSPLRIYSIYVRGNQRLDPQELNLLIEPQSLQYLLAIGMLTSLIPRDLNLKTETERSCTNMSIQTLYVSPPHLPPLEELQPTLTSLTSSLLVISPISHTPLSFINFPLTSSLY